MQEIFDEYGEFIVEAVGGFLFLGILSAFFLGLPVKTLVMDFVTSVLG